MREMSECPAALVTMLISVRGLGSATTTKIQLFNRPKNSIHKKNKNKKNIKINKKTTQMEG